MRGGEGERGKCYMLWAHKWACPATRWWLSSNDEARRRHGWKLATSISYKFVFLYFLNLYLCQRYFLAERRTWAWEKMTRPDEGWHRWKLAQSWEWDDNIWSIFQLDLSHPFNCISPIQSAVFLPVGQMYFSGARLWRRWKLPAGGGFGTVQHSCLGHPLQQLNMMEGNTNTITNTNTKNYKYKFKPIQI